ncbi:hypothetical protein [Pedobacter sp. CFBP9032]|uniref:hypothetical protein n=1 Tax=Pedobacter sp. CFBP9032 TaxID=3096539 RepID=UPI002A6A079D|nr:hypothetical protein [Pedobacter sp. CFBP9032]MDY0906288.1 hypothetical protein [Pedobacter sp. CFBP9032]
MENIASVSIALDNFELSTDYRIKNYVKNFNRHVDFLIETTSEINEVSIGNDKEFTFTDSIYWQCEASILENLDDVTDNEVLSKLDDLEDRLYSKLISSLGKFYRNGDRSWIDKMLDMTIQNTLLGLKFEHFSASNQYRNPWTEATDILLDNKLIYTFSDDVDHLKDLGLKISDKDSSEIARKLVGVAGKGHKKDFATGYFRDLTALRNMLYSFLESTADNSAKAIKKELIVKEIRDMGVKPDQLTDNNIQSWLIDPLKQTNRIGSNKDGYFVISTASDLIASYNSHFENFKGFYRTLDRHKRLAEKFEVPIEILDRHNEFVREQNLNAEDSKESLL